MRATGFLTGNGGGKTALLAVLGPKLMVASVMAASGPQNLLPNAGFEEGAQGPVGWTLVEGNGRWDDRAMDGRHALRVEGNGETQAWWRPSELQLAPRGLYSLRFAASREPGATGGTAVAGPERVNRDFVLGGTWATWGFVFQVPDDLSEPALRLGQWHVQGGVLFDNAELYPVQAVHAQVSAAAELGEAESLRDGHYRFTPNYGWRGANHHRPLFRNRARFNTDRWVFGPDAEVIYRFAVGQRAQQSARLRLNLNYHTAGALKVEAGRDPEHWLEVGAFDGQKRGGTVALPDSLFPAPEIYVRLSAAAGAADFQVNRCDYDAALVERCADAEGATRFLEILQSHPALSVRLSQAFPPTNLGVWQLEFALTNQTTNALRLRGSLSTETDSPNPARRQSLVLTTSGRMTLSALTRDPGSHRLAALLRDDQGRTLFAGRVDVQLGLLLDGRPGYWLQNTNDLGLWWAESGWKIGRDRAMPERPRNGVTQPVRVAIARGEYEPVQVVVRPFRDGQLLAASADLLRNSQGAVAPVEVRFNEVAYVQVTQPTDASSERGGYPDPLPPLQLPLALAARQNQPLWLTLRVPPETQAGDYQCDLLLKTSWAEARVPLAVHVYDFVLPAETHLRSALGLGTHEINRYHRLTRQEDQEAVFDQYLQNFAEHRISPYSFYDYAPMDIRFVGDGAARHAEMDFTRFDRAAARWLDTAHGNTFLLPLRGMGGGTFQSRHLGELEGFREGTPEHARLFNDYLGQVEKHLRERGWLAKAYTYWFDEPDPKDYEFVVAGMKRLKTAAPGLKRLLTEQPERALLGQVDIWCGLTPEWTRARVQERRAAGEEVWWYICTAPKAPYVTEFIDHPGTELRLWPWQSWQYGISGLLVWATVYWNSPLVFPEPARQDPWQDPMSYVSGYDFPVGHVENWGNGDGRFLYPPRDHARTNAAPILDGPVNSLRWENLRDGMEDYEYLWLLQQAIEKLKAREGDSDLARQAGELLTVPGEVSQDLTHFTTDPRPLLEHRDRVATMIERLQRMEAGN